MKNLDRHASEEVLAEANLANLYASTTFRYHYPGSEVYEGDDICWSITDIPVRAANVVFNARLSEKNIDDVITEITEKARRKKVPLRWYTDKNTKPGDLGNRLLQRGFTADDPVPMMAVDLHTVKEEATAPAELQIFEVADMDSLRVWENTCARGFGGSPTGPTPLFQWFTYVLGSDIPVRFFLALLEGKPVATSQLTLAEGVAGIDRVATVPDARKKGIGYAVTLFPLMIAREAGYHVGVLQASEAGAAVYSRMGFKQCGEMRIYHWNYTG